jgi:hypothetical protein
LKSTASIDRKAVTLQKFIARHQNSGRGALAIGGGGKDPTAIAPAAARSATLLVILGSVMSKYSRCIFTEFNGVNCPRAAIPTLQILNNNHDNILEPLFLFDSVHNDRFDGARLILTTRGSGVGEFPIDYLHCECARGRAQFDRLGLRARCLHDGILNAQQRGCRLRIWLGTNA